MAHVAITNLDEWNADATLFAVSTDRSRITVGSSTMGMGAGGQRRGTAAIWRRYAGPPLAEDPDARRRELDAYRVQRHDVEDAMNQLLGRDPKMHRPPRLTGIRSAQSQTGWMRPRIRMGAASVRRGR